jgi:hypothetical protein
VFPTSKWRTKDDDDAIWGCVQIQLFLKFELLKQRDKQSKTHGMVRGNPRKWFKGLGPYEN